METEIDMPNTLLWSDGAPAYRSIAKKMSGHRFVDHTAGQYVLHGAGTNLAEGYFSQLKRSLDGTHHHVSRVHLSRYLAQFDFMYSRCRWTDSQRMRDLLASVDGRRLTYKPLTGR
jgi:hypothetical protein